MEAPFYPGPSETPTLDLHILMTPDERGGYDAVCLEMGLATSGPDENTLAQDMLKLIIAHVRGCVEEGRPQDILVPAAPEHWKVYMDAVTSDACVQQALVPFPKELVYDEDEAVAHYTRSFSAQKLVCKKAA